MTEQSSVWAAATLQLLAAMAEADYADYNLPPGESVPPILIPEIGKRYFVAVSAGDVRVYFHAVLIGMYQDTPTAELDFSFDNGASVHGLPLLLPTGWDLGDLTEPYFTFSETFSDVPHVYQPITSPASSG